MDDEQTVKNRWPRLVWGLVGLIVVGAIIAGVSSIRARRLPRMDRVVFDASVDQWKENMPIDYEITVKVSGRQPGVYRVIVEKGLATQAWMDGRKLTRPRTFVTWAVDGMFETLQRDLDTHDRDQNLMLGAEFDEKFGYPKKYERLELRTGINDALQWEVTNFSAGGQQESP